MTLICWVILIIIAITNIYIVKNPGLSFVIFLLPFTFALLHSFMFFGKKHTLIIFAIIMLTSFTAEVIGVHTGKIFGHYFYNTNPEINGFLIGGVPPLVTFSYVSMGYISYVLARIILAQYKKLQGWMLLGVPILAALFMTMWDMAFDPITSYVQQRWTWETGGVYFGVPFHNFIGWFLTTLTFYCIISVYLHYGSKDKDYIQKPTKAFLALPIVYMAANAFSIVIKETTTNPTELQQAMALIALFGLGMPVAIATFRLAEQKLPLKN